MRWKLRLVAFLTASLTCWGEFGSLSAQNAPQPFAVVFLNDEINAELRADRNRQFARTIGRRVETDPSQIRRGLFHDMIVAEPNYAYVRGNAHFATNTGKYISAKFITVADEKAFFRLVEVERTLRSAATTIIDEGPGNVRLTTPPARFQRDGATGLVEYKDLFFRFSHGFLCTGGQEIFDLDMSAVRPFVDSARDEHIVMYVFPPRSTVQTRDYYLRPVLLGLNLQRQRRDNESDSEFSARSTVVELLSELIQGMFDDIDQVKLSVRYPTAEADELHIRGVASVQQNSKLARILRQLRPHLSLTTQAPDDALVSVGLNLGLPDHLKKCLLAMSDVQFAESPVVSNVVATLLNNESLQLETWMGLNEQAEPFVHGTMPISSRNVPSDDVAELLRVLADALQSASSFSVSDAHQFANHRLRTGADQGVLNWHWDSSSAAMKSADSDAESQTHIVDLRVNLAALQKAPDDAPVRSLVRRLEEEDFEFNVNEHPMITVMPHPPRATFTSFYASFTSEKPLKGRMVLDIGPTGDEVVFDLKCDGELYRLRDVRTVLQNEARLKLAGFK